MKIVDCNIWVEANLDVKHISEVETFCRTTGFPAGMSLYAEGKHSPVMWQVVEEIREQWEEELVTTDAVLIIGAHPVPDRDPHVWDGILGGRMDVGLVGTCDEEFSGPLSGRLQILGDRFEKSMDAIRAWLGGIA